MHADNWANKAKQEGYRTRAVYKLDEIIHKTKALKKRQNVLDLGSAPGGWSQYIKKKSPQSDVYAIDILEMDHLDGILFIDYLSKLKKSMIVKKLTKLKSNSAIL